MRVMATLSRMGSGYVPFPSADGQHMVFIHRQLEPFTLPTGPNLTLGDAWATIAQRVDMQAFLANWIPDEEF